MQNVFEGLGLLDFSKNKNPDEQNRVRCQFGGGARNPRSPPLMTKKKTGNTLAAGAGALLVGLAVLMKKGLPFLIGYGIATGISGRYSGPELAAIRAGADDVGARWSAVEELWADSSGMAAQKMGGVDLLGGCAR